MIIPHSKPTLTDIDAARVARVVRGGQVAQGPEVERFENEQPLAGYRISACVHVTTETANLARTLKAGAPKPLSNASADLGCLRKA